MNGKSDRNLPEKISFLFRRPLLLTFVIFTAAVLVILTVYTAKNIITAGNEIGNDGTAETSEAQSVIPDMMSAYGSEKSYVDLEAFRNEPFSYIKELDSYSRSIRIIQSFEGSADGELITITRTGDNFKAESDSRIIISSGNQLYVDYGTQSVVSSSGAIDFYRDVGITSLEMIRDMCADIESYESETVLSDDERVITAELTDLTTGIHMIFEINVETGVVVSERFYYQDVPYRFIITETFTKSVQTEDDFFKIPVE